MEKFGARTAEGIFVGYHLHSGGKWSGDYLVIDVSAYLEHEDGCHVAVHRVKEIIQPPQIAFPIKEGKIIALPSDAEQADRVIGELATHTSVEPTPWGYNQGGSSSSSDGQRARSHSCPRQPGGDQQRAQREEDD